MKKAAKPLNISLDNKSAVPVYEQVKQAIKWSILSGYLEDGDQLPSLRELAAMLRINPNTIVKIYFQLEVEGFLSSRAGSGFFVCQNKELADPQGRKLFEHLSREYIAKVIALGFSEQDIIDYLHSRTPKQMSGKAPVKENKNGDNK
jgi:GntR family transcriptional regulator